MWKNESKAHESIALIRSRRTPFAIARETGAQPDQETPRTEKSVGVLRLLSHHRNGGRNAFDNCVKIVFIVVCRSLPTDKRKKKTTA